MGYRCDVAHNFVADVQYKQINVTGDCDSAGSAREPACPRYCEMACDDMMGCTGFFQQRRQSGREVCGLYTGTDWRDARRVAQMDGDGRVCERVIADETESEAESSSQVNNSMEAIGLESEPALSWCNSPNVL